MTLEKLMIKAVKEFAKQHPKDSIRTIAAWDFGGNTATFNIEWADENGNYPPDVVIQVRAEG